MFTENWLKWDNITFTKQSVSAAIRNL